MKKTMGLVCLFVMLLSATASGQLWKNYADSAREFQKSGDANKALVYFTMANDILRVDSQWTESHGRIANTIAGFYWRKGQFDKTAEFAEEALQIAEKILTTLHPFYATSCHNLGMVYSTLGNYDRSEMYYLEAKRIREALFGKNHAEYASTCNTLGILYNDIGQYSLSEQYFKEAMQINEQLTGKETQAYALCCGNLADLYKKMAQFEKSEPMYLQAKAIHEKTVTKNSPEYAGVCNNLANLYSLFAKFDKAEQLLLEARSIYTATIGKEHPDYATNCHNLADFYFDKGQFSKAEPFYFEARKIYEKTNGKFHPDYARNANSIAMLYMAQNKKDESEKFFLEAAEVYEKTVGKFHADYAITRHDLAGLYIQTKQLEKALPLYTDARRVFGVTLGTDHPNYITSNENLASVYAALNNPRKALEFYTAAIQAQQNLMSKVFQVTSETEKLKYLQKVRHLNDETISLTVSHKKDIDNGFIYDLALAGRNVLLYSAQQLRRVIHTGADTSIYNTYNAWINLREKISFWYTQPKAKHPPNLAALEEQADLYDKELSRYLSTIQKVSKPPVVTASRLRENLNPGEAAIEFVAFQYRDGLRWTDSVYYLALILRKDKETPDLVRLFEERELDEILKVYKGTSAEHTQVSYLYTNGPGEKNTKPKSLYDLIWKPIEGSLAGISRVYFAPGGSLFKVSFSALPMGDNKVLGDKYHLVQLNTTASLINSTTTFIASSDKTVLYGGVQYDVDSTSMRIAAGKSTPDYFATRSIQEDFDREGVLEFRYLKGSGDEINGIQKLAGQNGYNLTMYEGKNATEESVKSLSGKNSPTILHIATHAYFFPDPKNIKKNERIRGREVFRQSENPLIRSGLALAGANNIWKGKSVAGVEDGILTAYEVSNMYLPNTKLAVLSACETGLGDIQGSEGVYGLQRAFKIAGVENLVMSLWKVPDAETAEFMQQFYKNLFAKQTIQDAFYNAQTTMKNKYRIDPYKWAAWVLIR